MKIDGVVVLYQPSQENIRHICEYAEVLNVLYVVDNSDLVKHELLRPLVEMQNVKYISMNGNQGIAAALRKGLDRAIAEEADFCLTMDQDSIFPLQAMPEIVRHLSKPDIDDYGIVAISTGTVYEGNELVEVAEVITSGNFINIKNYKRIAGFRTELFIDSVDFDICHQFYMAKKKIAYFPQIVMEHKIGRPKKKKCLFRTITVTNHSPIRIYYRFRNNYVLYHEDKRFYRKIYFGDFKQKIKIILFESEKREKLKMIRLGIKHAKQGKLGKLDFNLEQREE